MAERKKKPSPHKKTSTASPQKKRVRIPKLFRKKNKQKPIRIPKLFRKNAQKKSDKQLIRDEQRQLALEKQTAELSPELYVDAEEAMGPTIYNEGYLKKAAIYRNLRYGIIFVLVLFLFGMLNLYREEITIENFRYLMRNVNFELRTELGETGSISYTSNETNVFAIYKSFLAQLSDHRIAIYDADGRTSYTKDLQYSSPEICASEQFVLAYDKSGGDYSLYTTFSQAHSGSTGYPIADADLADNGTYVIASRSKQYFGVVEVYNSSFQLLNKIQKNKYIAAVDLSADGKMLLIASYYVGRQGIETELMSLSVDSDEPSMLCTLSGIFPWEVSWLEDTGGSFVLICEEGVKFFDSKGKIFNEYGFSDQNVIEYTVSSSPARVAVVTQADVDTDTTHVTLLSESGNLLLSKSYSESIQNAAITHDGLILLFGKTARRIGEDGTEELFSADSTLQTVVAAKEGVYLCTPTRAIIPEWKKQS